MLFGTEVSYIVIDFLYVFGQVTFENLRKDISVIFFINYFPLFPKKYWCIMKVNLIIIWKLSTSQKCYLEVFGSISAGKL
jgi:hypothetical protein